MILVSRIAAYIEPHIIMQNLPSLSITSHIRSTSTISYKRMQLANSSTILLAKYDYYVLKLKDQVL